MQKSKCEKTYFSKQVQLFSYYLFIFVKIFIVLSSYFVTSYAQITRGTVIIRRFSKEHCRINPCMNGGTCTPGKIACDCALGWMGQYCHSK